MTHYHVHHNIPGYLPEGDTPEPPLDDIRTALQVLADDLEQVRADIDERVALNIDGAEEDAELVEQEEDLGKLCANLEAAATPHPINGRYPSQVNLYGDPYPIDCIATDGLTIEVYDGRALPIHYHLAPCDETECAEGVDHNEHQ